MAGNQAKEEPGEQKSGERKAAEASGAGDLPRPHKSVTRSFLNFYLLVAVIYFFWALTILQVRECGLFARSCELDQQLMADSVVLSIITAFVPSAILYSALIAFFRALLWLPNLILDTLGGSFLNWLLLRDVPPMRDFLAALAGLLP